jgi:hypothetical protein
MRKVLTITALLAAFLATAMPAISHGGEVPLSSLDLAKVQQGWGTAQRDRSVTSRTLSIAGRRGGSYRPEGEGGPPSGESI